MSGDFILKKDRLIAAAVDIICDMGLSGLTTKNLAMKENMPETALYQFYADMNDLLADVVEYYAKFDKSIQKTVLAKEGTYLELIRNYVEAYSTYYDNYYAISTFMLHYEELLHNVYTRDRIAEIILDRRGFVAKLFQGALDAGELIDTFTASELADSMTSIVMLFTLNRRLIYHKESYKTELCRYIDKWLMTISKK